jgi:hypothetical protein
LIGKAALLVGLMFDHQHTLGWQIDHLAPFHGQARHLVQIVLTVLAVFHRVHDHQIGRRRQLQGVSCTAGLSSRLPAALLAQTLGLPVKAVGRGRQVAVVAIFDELGFQHADAFTQQRHLASLGGILLSELFQLFVFGHACTLLDCSLLCKPLVLLVSYSYSSFLPCTTSGFFCEARTPEKSFSRAGKRASEVAAVCTWSTSMLTKH